MPVLVKSEMEVHNLCVLSEIGSSLHVLVRMGVVYVRMGVVFMRIGVVFM